MILGHMVVVMREFMNTKGYMDVIEAYRVEKGLPKGFALTPEIKRELSERTSDILMERAKQLQAKGEQPNG